MIEVGDPLTAEQVRTFKAWLIHDVLTIKEAAWLSCGVNPRENLFNHEEEPNAMTVQEALEQSSAIRAARETFGDDADFISRKNLCAMFEAKGLRPAFLYPEAWEQAKKEGKSKPDGDLHPLERKSLHIIIAVLMQKAGLDPEGEHTASILQRAIEEAGASMSKRTIRDHVHAAAETLRDVAG